MSKNKWFIVALVFVFALSACAAPAAPCCRRSSPAAEEAAPAAEAAWKQLICPNGPSRPA